MFNPDLEISQPFTVRSSSVLTGSYVAGTTFSMDAHNALGLEVTYTKGSTDTALLMKVEVSNDGGTTYAQEITETISGGTLNCAAAERSWTSSGTYSILITPLRARLVKVSSMASGTATGTCAIKAYPLWV